MAERGRGARAGGAPEGVAGVVVHAAIIIIEHFEGQVQGKALVEPPRPVLVWTVELVPRQPDTHHSPRPCAAAAAAGAAAAAAGKTNDHVPAPVAPVCRGRSTRGGVGIARGVEVEEGGMEPAGKHERPVG